MGKVIDVKIDSVDQDLVYRQDDKNNITFQFITKLINKKIEQIQEAKNGNLDTKRSV